MGSTQSESIFEPSDESSPLPGALLIFSGVAPQLRAIPMRRNVPLVLGREDAGGVPLPDRMVSKLHCELTFDGCDFVVRDLDSNNGFSVNGSKSKAPDPPVVAAPGAMLRLGSSFFLLCEDVRRFQAATVTTGKQVIGPAYRMALDEVERGARSGACVLIMAETGSGKEFAARCFHEAAAKSGPFIAVNSSTIAGPLAASLLFGVGKGVGTDVKERPGHFREANGGTLFFDELGDMNLAVQVQLLRTVEDKQVQAVGSSSSVPVNTRIVSATHQDLGVAIEEGRFRKDLYYRLGEYKVRLPPLRERKEEIPWLIQHALGELVAHRSLVERALLIPWPGNVRELLHAMERAALNARAAGLAEVRDSHLEDEAGLQTGSHPAVVARPSRGTAKTTPASPAALASRPTREELVAALEQHDWNVSQAAERMNQHRTTVVRWMKALGIVRPAGHGEPDAG